MRCGEWRRVIARSYALCEQLQSSRQCCWLKMQQSKLLDGERIGLLLLGDCVLDSNHSGDDLRDRGMIATGRVLGSVAGEYVVTRDAAVNAHASELLDGVAGDLMTDLVGENREDKTIRRQRADQCIGQQDLASGQRDGVKGDVVAQDVEVEWISLTRCRQGSGQAVAEGVQPALSISVLEQSSELSRYRESRLQSERHLLLDRCWGGACFQRRRTRP